MCSGLEDFDFDICSFLADDFNAISGDPNTDIESTFFSPTPSPPPTPADSTQTQVTPFDFLSQAATTPTWIGESISRGVAYMGMPFRGNETPVQGTASNSFDFLSQASPTSTWIGESISKGVAYMGMPFWRAQEQLQNRDPKFQEQPTQSLHHPSKRRKVENIQQIKDSGPPSNASRYPQHFTPFIQSSREYTGAMRRTSSPGTPTPAQPIRWKPNATYLLCPTVEQVTPPPDGPWEEPNESDTVIVFLIPPSSLGGEDQDGTLEVTCQVTKVQTVNQCLKGSTKGSA